MLSQFRRSSPFRFALALFAFTLATAGCDGDTTEPEEEPDVATMRLTVGSQTVNVNAATGAVTGGPIIVSRTGTNVSAAFLRSDGQPDPLVTATTFRLDVEPANASVVTFSRTGTFAGTLIGVTAGQSTAVTFSLFHLEEGHEEFEWPVTVQVQ